MAPDLGHAGRDQLRDIGSGSVLALALCSVLVVGALATGLLGQAVLLRHRAGAAADLAALAAAGVTWPASGAGSGAVSGAVSGCTPQAARSAEQVARAHQVTLSRCSGSPDGSVVVEVSVLPTGILAGTGPVRASARAGPAP